MRWFRLHLRLLLFAAWLALGAQGVVAFEAAWHHHDDAPAGHKDGCSVCAAVAETGQPIDPPVAAPALEFCHSAPIQGHPLAAHLFALTALTSRGPPSTLAL